MTNTIIATCKICGVAGYCDATILLCQKCSSEDKRKAMCAEMAEVSSLAGMLHHWIKFNEPDPDLQAKALAYALAAIVAELDLNTEKTVQFLNTCVYEFQVANNLNNTDKH